jgi:hypothetical protein
VPLLYHTFVAILCQFNHVYYVIDPNAILVKKFGSPEGSAGRVKREHAAMLAPLLDNPSGQLRNYMFVAAEPSDRDYRSSRHGTVLLWHDVGGAVVVVVLCYGGGGAVLWWWWCCVMVLVLW